MRMQFSICYVRQTRRQWFLKPTPLSWHRGWGERVAIERELTVPNKEGLHFRPIMQLVGLAQNFQCDLTFHCEDRSADGRSPMELLMLVATHGATVRVVADGDDANEAVDAIARLFEAGFGET